jgi:hypothetical protein
MNPWHPFAMQMDKQGRHVKYRQLSVNRPASWHFDTLSIILQANPEFHLVFSSALVWFSALEGTGAFSALPPFRIPYLMIFLIQW